jgi:hypothetical protein
MYKAAETITPGEAYDFDQKLQNHCYFNSG